jgi:hypothetical protein
MPTAFAPPKTPCAAAGDTGASTELLDDDEWSSEVLELERLAARRGEATVCCPSFFVNSAMVAPMAPFLLAVRVSLRTSGKASV